MENKITKKILIIAGPTGVGESTITKELIKRYPVFTRLVTATTRPPRLKEKNKVDYYFFTEKEFMHNISNGNIIEHQNNRDGIYYGSYKPDLDKKLKKGFNIIMNPDIVGAKYYKKHYNATTIFILPDSLRNLKQRHLQRNPNISPQDLKKRLDYARHEIKNEAHFYDYKIVNKQGELEKTMEKLEKIIKKEGYSLHLN